MFSGHNSNITSSVLNGLAKIQRFYKISHVIVSYIERTKSVVKSEAQIAKCTLEKGANLSTVNTKICVL